MAYKDKEKQKQFQRLWKRKYNLEQKLLAIEILGGECKECGLKDFRCLEFDHIKPEMRGNNPNSSFTVIRKIVLGTLTSKEIQLLCSNCHSIKTYNIDRLTFKNRIIDTIL